MALLLEAHECAKELQRSPWDFAVEIGVLQAAGPTINALRWLVCKGYVEHGRETSTYGDTTRSFQRSAGLRFNKKTCFVLSEAGAVFAGTAIAKLQPCDSRVEVQRIERDGHAGCGLKPTWDRELQELRYGKVVIKQFKVPAGNQELILAAFEEEGWPVRIDDPLPPHSEQEPKRRLHDAIASLNRNQRHPLIHFLGDGSGQGIRWELALPLHNGHPDGDALQ